MHCNLYKCMDGILSSSTTSQHSSLTSTKGKKQPVGEYTASVTGDARNVAEDVVVV